MALALARFLKDILPTWKFIDLCKHFFHRCSDICFDNCNLLYCRRPNQKDERKKDRIDFISTDDSIGPHYISAKHKDPTTVITLEISLHSIVLETSGIINETTLIRLRDKKWPQIPKPLCKQKPYKNNNNVKDPHPTDRRELGPRACKGEVSVKFVGKEYRRDFDVL